MAFFIQENANFHPRKLIQLTKKCFSNVFLPKVALFWKMVLFYTYDCPRFFQFVENLLMSHDMMLSGNPG